MATIDAGPIPDLFDPDVQRDPVDAYRLLRRLGPVRDEGNGIWLLSRHRDVIDALHHPSQFASADGYEALTAGSIGPASRGERLAEAGIGEAIGQRMLIASDPPHHTALRSIVSRPFTRRRVTDRWEAMATELAGRLVDDLAERLDAGETADFVADLAGPLPITLIAEILDIPPSMHTDFRRWSASLVGSLGLDFDPLESAADLMEMVQFFAELGQDRRDQPGDDLISAIAAATPEGEQLTIDEVVLFCILLLVAGNETTTNLLGRLLHAFWAHPDQWGALLEDPGLVPGAVEEGLRFCGPVIALARQTTEDVAVGEVTIPAGDVAMLVFAAANRDESVFPDADRFLVDRPRSEHLAFGHGIHYCLGAQLARLEVRTVLDVLVDRRLALAPGGAAEPLLGPIVHGYRSIPVVAATG